MSEHRRPWWPEYLSGFEAILIGVLLLGGAFSMALGWSQPAAEPVRYEREVAADHATIEHLSALLEQARGARSSPPAREVPDSEVPDIEPWTGRTIAKHLRSIGMAIVYREGPRND